MGAIYSYKSPDGVWYICMGSSGPYAGYRTAPDGSFDPKAKAIADDFNNGGHSITIDGRTFKLPKKEMDDQNALDDETRKRIEEESVRIDKEKEKSRVDVSPEEQEEDWRRIEMLSN